MKDDVDTLQNEITNSPELFNETLNHNDFNNWTPWLKRFIKLEVGHLSRMEEHLKEIEEYNSKWYHPNKIDTQYLIESIQESINIIKSAKEKLKKTNPLLLKLLNHQYDSCEHLAK